MRAPRDAATVKKGTSVIKGHVFSSERRPLRRAQIRLVSGDPRDAVTTNTGIEGEYELRELPAGRYTVHATRSGYLPAQYGQQTYGEPGTPVEVANGATVEKIDFVLARAGVISGRVTDETGEPASGVDIRAMQLQFFQGRKRIVPVAGSVVHVDTDDTGQYRLTGLPPGEYLVGGRLRDTWMSDETEPQMLSYAPSYFPGTADAAEARRVKIGSGQEVGAIDFPLVPVRAAVLSGTAVAADGSPLSAGSIMLTQEIMGPGGGTMGFAGNAAISKDGTWTVRDIPPGAYVIRATGSVGDRPSETAVLPVEVNGADLDGLIVTADPGGILSGRIVTDTGEPLPASGSRISVAPTPLSMQTGMMRQTPGQADGVAGPDGRFTRKSMSGPVVIRTLGLPRGWTIKTIDIGGGDYAGLPVDVRPGQTVANITIVISKTLPALAGLVIGADSKPASATVLFFPVQSSRWIEAGGNQRTTRTDRAGTYRFDAVRPGEYFIVALEAMQQWQMNDPDFLAEQQKRAVKVTIGGEPVTLELKVVR
jgi:hypothetical protein